VLVSDGLYYENIKYLGKRIIVASVYLTTNDTSHILNTIIDGSQHSSPDSGSVVYFIYGEDTTSVLCGFTVRGGSGTYIPTFADYEGGGVFCWESGARLVRNIITGNNVSANAAGGGGITTNVITSFGHKLIMQYNIVTANTVTGTTGAGGAGIAIYNMDATVEDNVITNNSAISISGQVFSSAINYVGSGQTGRIINNIITDNTASTQATAWNAHGAVACNSVTVIVEGNLIARNSALAPNCTAYPSFGGGFSGWDVTLVFRHNIVVANIIQAGSNYAYGGGISIRAETNQHEVLVSENLIASNKAIGYGYGGGIAVLDEKARIENNIIVKNTASYGGGVELRRWTLSGAGTPTLINNTIAYNRATSGSGGGIVAQASWTPIMINTIAWGDTGTQEIALLNGATSGLSTPISRVAGPQTPAT
jgi:hypothetical protein